MFELAVQNQHAKLLLDKTHLLYWTFEFWLYWDSRQLAWRFSPWRHIHIVHLMFEQRCKALYTLDWMSAMLEHPWILSLVFGLSRPVNKHFIFERNFTAQDGTNTLHSDTGPSKIKVKNPQLFCQWSPNFWVVNDSCNLDYAIRFQKYL